MFTAVREAQERGHGEFSEALGAGLGLQARADLMRQIAERIAAHRRKQVEAAERCSVTQPRINDLLMDSGLGVPARKRAHKHVARRHSACNAGEQFSYQGLHSRGPCAVDAFCA